ncbi:hypothetical protein [Clostridium butyricum]|uniref:hypothetical protein n=1 Tax=Clostridium butyricum TaxID=1492 RepID=UPI002ABDB910|nr:hypothetical protein [Clostridium butyricum]
MKRTIDYLREDVTGINEDIQQIDERVILKIQLFYENKSLEKLERIRLVLKNKIKKIRYFNIETIIALVISILTAFISLGYNTQIDKCNSLLDETLNKVDEYDSENIESYNTISKYDDLINKLNKAFEEKNEKEYERIENELNNHWDYVKANENMRQISKKKIELLDRANERIQDIQKEIFYFERVKVILIIIIIFVIALGLYSFLRNIKLERINVAYELQINVIENIIDKKGNN